MGRAPCCSKVGLHKGPWTAREDALLLTFIQVHGEGQWRSLPKKAGLLRCGKSCRLRWMNYLRPDIKRGNITRDEEDLIIRLHGLLGNRWSLIAGRLPGRTDNEIKNYWNTHLSKKLLNQGWDPKITHKKLSETEFGKSANSRKKRGRSSNAKKGKAPKIHKKEFFINNNNNNNNNENSGSEENRDDERTQIHLPKPIRVTSTNIPLTRRNGSLETTATSGSSSQNHGLTLFDPDNALFLNCDAYNNFMDDDYHGDGGLDNLMMIDHHDEIVAPPDDAVQLEKLYEEYLQLIKADHDDDDGAQLDSFTESFLI